MNIIRTIVVKQVLTEQKKATLHKQFEGEKVQLEKEIQQLKFQFHKTTKGHNGNQENQRQIRNSYQKEIKKREEQLKALSFKIQQLHKLELGSEIRDGTVQSVVEVNVGDVWDERMHETELIIKDGIVHEIREGRKHDE
ncbi:YlqD family protein [Halalkalibacterium ligniniphilum]|uniref:YlqD family protein n=1 Tax=Halalkalibacterium ligniniphilum TaxID=1134413 RepID=UPI00034CCD86|nr:YlqD family protein [Halalkalibacterium ligniniphilum]